MFPLEIHTRDLKGRGEYIIARGLGDRREKVFRLIQGIKSFVGICS